MIFHPETLSALADFKMSSSSLPSIELLAFIIDNRSSIDINLLFNILYSHKDLSQLKYTVEEMMAVGINIKKLMRETIKLKNTPDFNHKEYEIKNIHDIKIEDSSTNKIVEVIISTKNIQKIYVKILENLIVDNFVSVKINGTNVCILEKTENKEILKNRDNKYSELGRNKNNVVNKLKRSIETVDSSLTEICDIKLTKDIIDEVPNKKKKIVIKSKNIDQIKSKNIESFEGNNSFIFKKVKFAQEKQSNKFEPVDLSHAIYVFNRNNLIKDTFRKRDDLINPRKLQFYSFAGQRKPNVYRLKTDDYKYVINRENKDWSVFSTDKLANVLDYDVDSDMEWEENEEEAVDCLQSESYSIEESSEGSLTDFIDKNKENSDDNEEMKAIVRNNRKPSFITGEIKIEKYFDL
ncbi:hypothetical protein NUSPORA_01205 [Nucleospora cyclopteri]